VELAGFEPASGQSVKTPSTCLFTDWFFENGLVQQQTHPHLILCVSPADRGISLGNPTFLMIRGGLYSRHQNEEGDAWRCPHAAQRLSNSLELGSHGILSVASQLSNVVFYRVTAHALACLQINCTFPSIPDSPMLIFMFLPPWLPHESAKINHFLLSLVPNLKVNVLLRQIDLAHPSNLGQNDLPLPQLPNH